MDLTGWIPVRVYPAGGGMMVDWCFAGGRRFSEPFFDDTIARLRRETGVRCRQTTLAQAAEWAQEGPGLPPAGLVFHMSRCGSTLVSRMLAALPQNRVLSEPPALEGALRAGPDRHAQVRTIVRLLGRPLDGETSFFLKLDCWHILDLPLILEAFPGTPWVFLYRDPAAVLASHLRMPGAWTVPGWLPPEVLRLGPGGPRLEYCALALARLLTAAVELGRRESGLLVNYAELPEAACRALPRHFRRSYDARQIARMQSAARFDAKAPSALYAGSPGPPAEVREVAARVLMPLYQRLESLRSGTEHRPATLHPGRVPGP